MEKEELELLNQKQEMYRHSMSHILAKAIKQLYPNVKLAIGPAIDNGFYYDFDNVTITPEDFGKIEDKMREIINKNEDFVRLEVSKQEALDLFKDEPYKYIFRNIELASVEKDIYYMACYMIYEKRTAYAILSIIETYFYFISTVGCHDALMLGT